MKAGWIVTLAILALFIVIGGVFGPSLLQRFMGNTTSPRNNTPVAQTPPATATALQIQTERERYKQLARQIVDKMSLEDLIGQLIVVNPIDLQDDLQWMVSKQHVSGVILYDYSMTEKTQTQQLIQQLQNAAATSLFVTTDGEGGSIDRLKYIYPDDPLLLGSEVRATGNPQVATQQGQKAAQRFTELGINTGFAPTVDVYASKESYMHLRSFGSTPEEVIKYAAPNLSAIQQGGVIGTLKHFPGMGRATDDPHAGVVTINATQQEFYQTDLAPFKYLIQSQKPFEQPGMIMTTYALVPSIDSEEPAQYSYTFITKILRQEFGYDGVVITDDLGNMVPAKSLGIGPASVLSLQAGCDLLLGAQSSDQVDLTIQAIKAALTDGTLSNERLKESATRILALKMQYKIIPASA
jgi:beta-N-acetylhexosaminidase